MDAVENLLRAVRFDRPDHVPMLFHINDSCWHHYDQDALKELMASHKFLFPDFEKTAEKIEPEFKPWMKSEASYIDGWECVWQTADDGIFGTAIEHPLESWDDFEGYKPPDPEKRLRWGDADWNQIAKTGCTVDPYSLIKPGLQHGHTFQTLADIRGYENLLFDMADEELRLYKLIEMVENFNMAIVKRYLALGAEWLCYPEDLGMQAGPMVSPEHFRKYIKPSYQRLMAPARQAGCIVHMHSDGDIRDLVDDIIDGGVEILNLQDIVNGIGWIKENLAGKVCIDLDIDRQQITPFATPTQIDDLIGKEVRTLGSREGGLMMIYGLYPGVPLENIKALMDAMEKYAFLYS